MNSLNRRAGFFSSASSQTVLESRTPSVCQTMLLPGTTASSLGFTQSMPSLDSA